MTKFENLTEHQIKILESYSFGAVGWFSAVNRLTSLGLPKKEAEKLVDETGQISTFD